jgi:hypothetical protein
MCSLKGFTINNKSKNKSIRYSNIPVLIADFLLLLQSKKCKRGSSKTVGF